MRVLLLVSLMTILGQAGFGQKFWDGGALTNQWTDSANWYPDGVPNASDEVIFNNLFLQGDYSVSLPVGNIITQVFSLAIRPLHSNILIILPAGNIASPGLQINSIDTGLFIQDGGILKNSSGASSGNSILLSGKMVIFDGGRYIHQTARSNASISDKLVFPQGTSKGIFEFDVPGTSGYTISITGKTFGNLYFKSLSSGGNKSYSGSGSTNLTIKGDLWIDVGANLTSTMTADIFISGNLVVDGKLTINPSTAGISLRRVVLEGTNVQLGGRGIITMNSNFRNIEIGKYGFVSLKRNLTLANSSNMFINYGKLYLDTFYIGGAGKFMQMDSGFLSIGDLNGINFTNSSGNIRTESKSFSKITHYQFNGSVQQVTGDALPDTISIFSITNPMGLILSKMTVVADSLFLQNGIIKTSDQKELVFHANHLQSNKNSWNRYNGGWEQSYINGPFSALITGNSSFEMPSGNELGYAPFIIYNLTGKTETFRGKYENSIPFADHLTTNILALHPYGYWSINTTSQKYNISIPLSPNEINETPQGTTITVGIFNDSLQSWTVGNASISHNPDEVFLDSLLLGNQTLTLGYYVPEIILPLDICDFQGKANNNSLQFFWNYSGNNKSGKFIIQESSNGQIFKDIGFIDLSAENKKSNNFKWVGKSTIHNEYGFYRLKYAEDGLVKYSPVLKIKLLEQVVFLYPNPASEFFFLKFQNPCNEYLLEIVNIYGLIVQKEKFSGKEVLLKINNLKPGSYFIRITAENFYKILGLTKY